MYDRDISRVYGTRATSNRDPVGYRHIVPYYAYTNLNFQDTYRYFRGHETSNGHQSHLDECIIVPKFTLASRAPFLGWMPLFVFFGLPIVSCSLIKKSHTRMLVTFGICFKQHFDTRYLVFYNTSPPRMFLSLDLLWEYRIQHSANGPLYVTSSYSTWIFCRGVSGFATDCPCGVWCRGFTTCLLHVDPPFGNRILNNSWAVGLT